MDINQAIAIIAERYNLNENELKVYALEDEVGGYHTAKSLSKWEIGSLWAVEGKILYSLIRALKPLHIVEVGSYHGCSTTHICEALLKNNKGRLTSVDVIHRFKVPAKYKKLVRQIQTNAMNYTFPKTPKVDFVFDDAMHSEVMTSYIWRQFRTSGKKGGMIVSHDSEHHLVGHDVKAGIEHITSDYLSLLVQPSDCGLAMWRNKRAN